MRCVAAILTHVRDDLAPGAFVGHLAPTEFLIILNADQIEAVEQALSARLEEALSFFYPYADRQESTSSLPLGISTYRLIPVSGTVASVAEIKASLTDAQQNRSLDKI
jgi:GGDEF domain-containing protein